MRRISYNGPWYFMWGLSGGGQRLRTDCGQEKNSIPLAARARFLRFLLGVLPQSTNTCWHSFELLFASWLSWAQQNSCHSDGFSKALCLVNIWYCDGNSPAPAVSWWSIAQVHVAPRAYIQSWEGQARWLCHSITSSLRFPEDHMVKPKQTYSVTYYHTNQLLRLGARMTALLSTPPGSGRA